MKHIGREQNNGNGTDNRTTRDSPTYCQQHRDYQHQTRTTKVWIHHENNPPPNNNTCTHFERNYTTKKYQQHKCGDYQIVEHE